MKKKQNLIIILVLMLGIVFAATAVPLRLISSQSAVDNPEDYNVKFTSASEEDFRKRGGETASHNIDFSDYAISVTPTDFQAIYDETIVKFTIKNNSTQYDSNVTVNCEKEQEAEESGQFANNGDYYDLTVKVNNEELSSKNGTAQISAKTEVSGTLSIKLIKAPYENRKDKFVCTLSAEPLSRSSKAN